MNKVKNIFSKKINIVLMMIILAIITLITTVLALSPDNASFTINYHEMGRTKNIFCDEESAHMCIDRDGDGTREYAPDWYYRRSSTTTYTNTKRAYILANAYENRTNPSYGDSYQEQWWAGTSNAAEAFAEYRKNPNLKITNLKRASSSSISFTLSGNHNDRYGFGKITSVAVYDASTNARIKTVTNARYGTNTITGLDAYSVYIKVNYGVTGAEAKLSKYDAVYYYDEYTGQREYTSGQPLVVFEGHFTNENKDVTSDIVELKTNVSLQKYITHVEDSNGNVTYNDEARKNKYADEDKNLFTEGNYNHQGSNISNQNKVSGSRTQKLSNPVQIELGDTVTYKIIVYNNSNTATKVKIRDIWNIGYGTMVDAGGLKSVTSSGDSAKYESEEFNLNAGAERTFTIKIRYDKKYTSSIIRNKVWMSWTEVANDTDYRTIDADYVKMKPYKVSLQKIVYSVNNNTSEISGFNRWESWESNANVNNSPANETYNRGNRYAKHNNPVTVANGDTVTYAVRVRNDGDTRANITQIIDTLPDGVSLENVTNESGNRVSYTINGQQITISEATGLLNKNETRTYYVTVTVTESNMSTRLLRNYAEITKLSNKNNLEVPDETQSNNQDADYIQLKDIIIAGTVWNDKALDKKQDNYNGVYDEKQENKLSDIKVMLYREGKGVIATTTTDENGNYSFDASKIDSSVVTEQCERHIKAPYTCTSNYSGNVKHGSNYWKENGYYSYYIVFEYDGITYTSTTFADVTSDNDKDSNAKEDNGPVEETRKEFNDRFSTINNQSGIEYTTKNESGYIPQSNHVYNEETMAMQSSTSRISLSNTASLEQQLTHVNLGLRGRDVFDLSLTSDVYSTKVTVNGQEGTYNYNSNKVTVRKSDISVAEDAANFTSEKREATVGEVGQAVRTTDLDVGVANNGATNPYTSTGLGIEVTYKITVTNESQTVGTASKVIDYYDSRYTFQRAYIGDTKLNTQAGETGTGFKSVIITTTGNQLAQSETMDIYVVYRLNEPTTTLAALLSGTQRIPTYNMAEVYEYKTYTTNNNEATRGLLDKDSAPGSANTETVRLANGSSNETTVRYYFNAQNLSNLKYEDDTYAAPTLYFTKDDNGRTLSGVVFRDNTTTDEETRVKTGNGIQDDEEVGVYGATVELVEISNPGDANAIAKDAGTIRYTLTTDENGNYTFSNFLPGNYIIRYHYGDKTETVLLHQHENGVNNYSYNGEDYQSTNNIGAYGAEKLNEAADIWYAYNEKEGVSTATDNESRRSDVTDNVTNFTDEEMTVLNNVRDGEGAKEDEQNSLIDKTYMFATTPGFTLSVEKIETDNNNQNPTQKDAFSEYNIQNMNFGIAEVPVTTIDLQKHVASFTIKDSAGDNTIASLTKNEEGEWVTTGDVLPSGDLFDVSIEDEKLQGARLEVTYNVTISMTTEKDFTNRELTIPTVDGIADFIDNDLSYNESLGENSKYWEVTTYDDIKTYLAESQYKEGSLPQGTVDSEGTGYTTVLKAKEGNPILLKETGTASCPITLEKVLSSEEVTVGDIITSSINTYEYDNIVEITKLDYGNAQSEDGSIIFRDRVRTPDRYIILAGTQHDSAMSETIAIHPPTGTNNSITYYIIAVISLVILATGIVFIKKYAIKGKDEK